MSDPYVHLHVASGYSLQYGTAHPRDLVTRAADYGMDTLGLTDRGGLYGAVRFATACQAAGIRPVLGVDLAVAPDGGPLTPAGRRPVRGGATVEDPSIPRVVVLAAGRVGYARLCRLVSAIHLDPRRGGERGRPLATPSLLAEHLTAADAGDLVVLLGPTSDVGHALAARRPDRAGTLVDRWRSITHPGDLVLEAVHHRAFTGDVSRTGAARTARFAAERSLPAVLTNAVRYLDPADAPIADVLDAARRLVPLGDRHASRPNAEAHLKPGKLMADLAEEVARAAGDRDPTGVRLLAATRRLADRCALDPERDLGIGTLHLPELILTRPDGVRAPTDDAALRARCEAGLGRRAMVGTAAVRDRLDTELSMIGGLGYAPYFLTVARVVDLIREMGVRAAARGSGTGSLVTYLTGVSDVDPIRYGLLMERFLSPLRQELPDVDLDVESARRTEVYERILAVFGGDRVACVAMMDTYRARHAVRDVGAALGLPPAEVDTIAKAFPHIRASQLRAALRDLPELRASGLGDGRYDLLFRLAERLDGLPRHIALHPCGVLLSDATLLDRTPVEASFAGFPMSQYDKDDVEAMGLLKLDVLGIRMQSAISHCLAEVERVDGARPDVDGAPRDDPETFALIQSTRTLGCFQIESPGQRELVGKFAPETFDDLIVDISLFRPGPVKSDMVRPFLEARQGWKQPTYPHPSLAPALAETYGVVVFHEQVLQMFAIVTGCSLAEADEFRRALGDPDQQAEVHQWFVPAARERGYDEASIETIWSILQAFASFGFCKAHAAAFALPTYQSAWLKRHHPAAFLAGVLTHDPGMYPKRLILDDARQLGIAILGLDINRSDGAYRVEKVGVLDEPPPEILDQLGDPTRGPRDRPSEDPHVGRELPLFRDYGIRLGLDDVSGITEVEVARIVAGRPYRTLSDLWFRASPSRPVAERLVLAGALDSLYGLGSTVPGRRRGQVTRRDLLLQVVELAAGTRGIPRRRGQPVAPRTRTAVEVLDPRTAAGAQRRNAAAVGPVDVQLALDLDAALPAASGLPEMTSAERVRAELDVLGLDASEHVLTAYQPLLDELGIVRSKDLLGLRAQSEILVAGVKVATQTPPVRSGRRVVFVTLDDATGPVDATLFEEAQDGFAATVFHSWLLVIRGRLRRTGPRGVSLLALGCWELPQLYAAWRAGGLPAVEAAMGASGSWGEAAVRGAAGSRSTRPVTTPIPVGPAQVYASGFRLSPYADIRPSGTDPKAPPRKLWHASPGSSGR
ncbi:MAG TPA: DNA polymerase III subunit alpha [Mycobacteriales bacterium]